MRVVGTAGHVDHGKSTLVAALTGIHPDRLKEEQAREMTIDLGFAWLDLPGGETVGIVDVPGHRDFIENMLAGVGGIDAVLLVIAADEGVMPQTREHLAILDLLQVQGGVIVLTKTDLVDDSEWLDLVEADVREVVQDTVLAEAALVRVSARTGSGLDQLKTALEECLAARAPRPDLGRARLPIDRVFTMPGFGTVVTGTLIDGFLRLGEDVEILPQGLRGRVRGLQTHKRKEEAAVPGSRTAVNISGVEFELVRRGSVVAHPGRYQPSQRLDASFRLLPDASGPLRHSAEVKLYLGAAEVLARVRLIGADELKPGEEGWLQIELRDPVIAARGDRYILRRPSPGETLGGGAIVDPHPKRRYKRFDPAVLHGLASLSAGQPHEVLLQSALTAGPVSMRDLVARSHLDLAAATAALDRLVVQEGLLVQLEPGKPGPQADLLVITSGTWAQVSDRALEEINEYHRAYPLRRGMPREELKSRLKWPPRLFNAALRRWTAAGDLIESGTLLARAGHALHFTPQQQTQIERLLARFAAAPTSPPSVKESQAEVGEEVYAALVELGRLVQVSPEVVFRQEDYDSLLKGVQAHFAGHDTLTVAEFRDRFNTSRKYALGFLEHLDAVGVTQRDGDARRLRRR